MNAMNALFDIQYLPVAGTDRYYVGSDGSMWIISGGQIRQPKITIDRHGYCYVPLYMGKDRAPGVPKNRLRPVHQLVLEAFVGPRPDGTECCHGNGKPADNRVENLRWDTRLANVRDSMRHGVHPKGESHGQAKFTLAQVREMRRRGKAKESLGSLAEAFKSSKPVICNILKNKRWRETDG